MSSLNPLLPLFAATILLPGTITLAAPIEVVPPELLGAIQPQVAVAPSGDIHVAFGEGESIYHTVSSDRGRTFSKPVRIAELPKLALGMRRGPRVTATDRVVTVSAISHSEGNLYVWTSSDRGATWSQATRINAVSNSAREGLHAMATDGKGATYLVWLDLRNSGMELWSVASRDGGLSWSENTRVYHSPDGHICECCHPSVAVGPDGRVAAMWRNWVGGARDMYLAQSNDGGKSWSAGQKIGQGTWKLNACPMDGGGITFLATGEMVTAWRREKAIYLTDPLGTESMIADRALQPVAFLEPSGYGVLWQSGTQIWVKRSKNRAPSMLVDNGLFPAVAGGLTSGPVVVWEGSAGEKKTIFADVLD